MDAQNIIDLADYTNNATMNELANIIQQVMELPDESLTDTTVDSIIVMITGGITPAIHKESVDAIIQNFKDAGINRVEAHQRIDSFKTGLDSILNDELKPSAEKRTLLETIFNIFYTMFDEVLERYLSYDITLPIKLDEGAQMPTYAHETDACADLYISENFTVPAHTMSTKLPTGVHIALPSGWLALIFPRSSIGFKTPLRLSNSAGVIDEEYRGEIGVLYDNVSDSDVSFNKGDRIAQMMVMPSYKFKPILVDELPESKRGTGGFGSSGK